MTLISILWSKQYKLPQEKNHNFHQILPQLRLGFLLKSDFTDIFLNTFVFSLRIAINFLVCSYVFMKKSVLCLVGSLRRKLRIVHEQSWLFLRAALCDKYCYIALCVLKIWICLLLIISHNLEADNVHNLIKLISS